jgi:hypothetical protein
LAGHFDEAQTGKIAIISLASGRGWEGGSKAEEEDGEQTTEGHAR